MISEVINCRTKCGMYERIIWNCLQVFRQVLQSFFFFLFFFVYCKSRIFRMHVIFVYFVRSGFRTKIKFMRKVHSKSEHLHRSATVRKFRAYERLESPGYENWVCTKYSGFTVIWGFRLSRAGKLQWQDWHNAVHRKWTLLMAVFAVGSLWACAGDDICCRSIIFWSAGERLILGVSCSTRLCPPVQPLTIWDITLCVVMCVWNSTLGLFLFFSLFIFLQDILSTCGPSLVGMFAFRPVSALWLSCTELRTWSEPPLPSHRI